MFRNGAIKAALGVLASASLVIFAIGTYAGTAFADAVDEDPFTVQYFINAQTSGPDDTLRITDPDAYKRGVDACANIYVFDPAEEMVECCACFITPSGRLDFSVNKQLTALPVTGQPVNSGTIKIVRTNINELYFIAPPTEGVEICDPTNGASNPLNIAFAPTVGYSLLNWITHDLNRFSGAVGEEEFQSTGEPVGDFDILAAECAVTQTSGGSYPTASGICGCGTEVQ